MNADDYTAQVLAYYFAQFLRIAEQDSQAFLLGYQNDGVAMMENLAQYLNLSFDAHEWQSIRERCGYHAKYPNQAFQKDVPPDLVPDYLRSALALYGQLESKQTTFPQKAH